MSSDENVKDLDEGNEEQEDTNKEEELMIPPFVPNQTVFTCNLEHRQLQQKGPFKLQVTTPSSSTGSSQHPYFEAVIRQVRHHPNIKDPIDSWSFYIHFKGWNARYDRWISASQLVPDTPETRKIYEEQQNQEKEKQRSNKESSASTSPKNKDSKTPTKSTPIPAAAAPPPPPAVTTAASSISSSDLLPFTLKTIVIEEWEKITRNGYDAPYGFDTSEMMAFVTTTTTTTTTTPNGSDNNNNNNKNNKRNTMIMAKAPPRSVHVLPCSVTVRQFMKFFEKKIRKKWKQEQMNKIIMTNKKKTNNNNNMSKEESVKEENDSNNDNNNNNIPIIIDKEKNNQYKIQVRQFCKGLCDLFEKALPICLLYSQERPQYEYYILKQKDDSVSVLDVYGCEFLLRLIIRLPYITTKDCIITSTSSSSSSFTSTSTLLKDMILLLQQNRTICFKGKYQTPKYPYEWLEWEKKYYNYSSSIDNNNNNHNDTQTGHKNKKTTGGGGEKNNTK